MLHYYVGCNRSLRRTRNILRHLLCFISHVPQSLGVRNSVDITVRRGGVLVVVAVVPLIWNWVEANLVMISRLSRTNVPLSATHKLALGG